MKKEDLQELCGIWGSQTVREWINLIRRNPKKMDAIVAENWLPDDPTRQLFRRAMRYAVDAPDIEWEQVLQESDKDSEKGVDNL